MHTRARAHTHQGKTGMARECCFPKTIRVVSFDDGRYDENEEDEDENEDANKREFSLSEGNLRTHECTSPFPAVQFDVDSPARKCLSAFSLYAPR